MGLAPPSKSEAKPAETVKYTPHELSQDATERADKSNASDNYQNLIRATPMKLSMLIQLISAETKNGAENSFHQH